MINSYNGISMGKKAGGRAHTVNTVASEEEGEEFAKKKSAGNAPQQATGFQAFKETRYIL